MVIITKNYSQESQMELNMDFCVSANVSLSITRAVRSLPNENIAILSFHIIKEPLFLGFKFQEGVHGSSLLRLCNFSHNVGDPCGCISDIFEELLFVLRF